MQYCLGARLMGRILNTEEIIMGNICADMYVHTIIISGGGG